MLRRQLAKALGWLAKSLKGFLDSPLRAINAAGLTMGALFIAIFVVLVIAMFSHALATSALAAVIAPLLQNMALALLVVIAVVIMVQLGFKNFSAKFMGAEVEASMVAEASQDAAQALQDLSASIGSDDPS